MWCFPFVLWHCWLSDRKGIRPVKNWMLVYWWWWFDWSFARLIAPVVTTTSILCFNKHRLTKFHLENGRWERLNHVLSLQVYICVFVGTVISLQVYGCIARYCPQFASVCILTGTVHNARLIRVRWWELERSWSRARRSARWLHLSQWRAVVTGARSLSSSLAHS